MLLLTIWNGIQINRRRVWKPGKVPVISTAVIKNSFYNDKKLYEGEYCCNFFKLQAWKNIPKTSGIIFLFEIQFIRKEGLGRIERQDSLVLKNKNENESV